MLRPALRLDPVPATHLPSIPLAFSCAVQTSLAQFVELYEKAIDDSERAVLPAKRIHNILEHLTCGPGREAGEGAGRAVGRAAAAAEHMVQVCRCPVSPTCAATRSTYTCSAACLSGTSSSLRSCWPTRYWWVAGLGGWVCARRGWWGLHGSAASRVCRCVSRGRRHTPANTLQVSAGQVRPEAVEVFLKMGGALDLGAVRKKPRDWVPGAGHREGCAQPRACSPPPVQGVTILAGRRPARPHPPSSRPAHRRGVAQRGGAVRAGRLPRPARLPGPLRARMAAVVRRRSARGAARARL